MRDAAVGMLLKIGVKRGQLLEYLQTMFEERHYLKSLAFVLKHIQREEGIHPENAYTIEITSVAPVYVGDVDPVFVLNIASPSKGFFTNGNIVFEGGSTGLTIDETTVSSDGTSMLVQMTGTAVAGELTMRVFGSNTLNGVPTNTAAYEIIVDPEE